PIGMRRWTLRTPIGMLRVHHILRSDSDRDYHDHPMDFVSLIFGGWVHRASARRRASSLWPRYDRAPQGGRPAPAEAPRQVGLDGYRDALVKEIGEHDAAEARADRLQRQLDHVQRQLDELVLRCVDLYEQVPIEEDRVLAPSAIIVRDGRVLLARRPVGKS